MAKYDVKDKNYQAGCLKKKTCNWLGTLNKLSFLSYLTLIAFWFLCKCVLNEKVTFYYVFVYRYVCIGVPVLKNQYLIPEIFSNCPERFVW